MHSVSWKEREERGKGRKERGNKGKKEKVVGNDLLIYSLINGKIICGTSTRFKHCPEEVSGSSIVCSP